jgi:hypothetical protein
MLYLTDLRPCKWAMSHDPEDARIVQTSILVPSCLHQSKLYTVCYLASADLQVSGGMLRRHRCMRVDDEAACIMGIAITSHA